MSQSAGARHDLPQLDALRGVAALAIVVHHVGWETGASRNSAGAGIISRLDVGVALFFALSGFLLFRPWVQAKAGMRPPVDNGTYLWRRVVRIFPPFLVVCAAVWALSDAARATARSTWLLTIFLQQNYFVSLWHQPRGLGQVWSLAAEVGFYLLLPVLAGFVLRGKAHASTPVLALGALATLGVLWTAVCRAHPGPGSDVLLGWTPAYMDWFVGGMLLAWWRERPQGPPRPVLRAASSPYLGWGAAALLFLLVTPPRWGAYDFDASTSPQMLVVRHVVYGIIAVLVILPMALGPHRGWDLAVSAPLRWLGTLSYGLFLWHMAVLLAIRPQLEAVGIDPGFWTSLGTVLVISLALALASWIVIEKPLTTALRNPSDLRRLGTRVSFAPVPTRKPDR